MTMAEVSLEPARPRPRGAPLQRDGRDPDPSDQPGADRVPAAGSCLRSPGPSRIPLRGARPGPRTTWDKWVALHPPTQATRTPVPLPRSAEEDPRTLCVDPGRCQPRDDLRKHANPQVTAPIQGPDPRSEFSQERRVAP